jgi:hypothetical protein
MFHTHLETHLHNWLYPYPSTSLHTVVTNISGLKWNGNSSVTFHKILQCKLLKNQFNPPVITLIQTAIWANGMILVVTSQGCKGLGRGRGGGNLHKLLTKLSNVVWHAQSANPNKTGLVALTRRRKLPGFFEPHLLWDDLTLLHVGQVSWSDLGFVADLEEACAC